MVKKGNRTIKRNEYPGLWTVYCLLGPLVFYELCMEAASFACAGLQIQDALAATGGGALLAIPILFFIYRKKQKQDSGRCVNFSRCFFAGCLLSFLAGAGACLCLNPLILTLFPVSKGWNETRAVFYEAPLFFRVLVTACLAPVAEELIFRGLIRMELRRLMEPSRAILVGAALFGLYHGNISQGIYAFLLGICLELVCFWGNSMIPALCLHVGANVVSLCLSGSQKAMQTMHSMPSALFFAAAGLCLAVSALYKTKEVFGKS